MSAFSSTSELDPRARLWSEPVYRLSVEQYHEMIRTGVLTDDDPVELIDGVLSFKMPKNPPHETVLGWLQDLLPTFVPPGWHVRLQAPITLENGEPEPDVAIIRGKRGDFRQHHPGPAEVGLVIEVSDTTQQRDRGVKLRSYARAGLPVYWVVDLQTRQVEVYTRPTPGNADDASYQTVRTFGEGEAVPVELDGQPVGLIPLADFLPPQT